MIGGPFCWIDSVIELNNRREAELRQAKKLLREHRRERIREFWGFTKFVAIIFLPPMLLAFVLGGIVMSFCR